MTLRSLRTRFALSIVLIEVVMLTILLWTTIHFLGNSYRLRLADSAENIAQQYAATAARYLFESDLPSLAEYSQQVARHKELAFIKVYDRRGNLLYSLGTANGAAGAGGMGDPEAAPDDFLVVGADIALAEQRLGRADLGFTYALLRESLAAARWRGILIAAGEVMLTILAGLWLSSRLTRGLRSLSTAVDRYGTGDLSARADVSDTSEVGRTAAAFNRMMRGRAEADAALRANEEKFRALVENSKDLIIVLSGERRITYASPSACQLLGRDPDEFLGRSLGALLGKDADEVLDPRLDELCHVPGQVIRIDMRARHASGAELQFELIAQNHLDNPAVEGIVLNFWDITERRMVEEQLQQSIKMEAIGNLTGGVAHDFNNLLAVILGNLELFQEDADPAARAQYIESAIEASLKGADLTRSLLSFARRAPLEPTQLDLNQIVRTTKNWSARVLPETIAVETSLLAGLWTIEADRGSTENALLNLILNARDAMPGGGKLTLETANVRIDDEYNTDRDENLVPGRYVMLAVSDTGEGIPPEIQEQIFEPFFTTKRPGKGSGLGLSMVLGFMKQSAGTVRVYSEPGAGTTFKLYFKATSGSEEPVQETNGNGNGDAEAVGTRILVAEDDPGVMAVVVQTLEQAGYAVIAAPSGDAARAIFPGAGRIDLLLTDIVMPGTLQGPALARELREIQPSLRAVFMSGYASEATIHGNGLRPEDVRLMKPIRKRDLIKAIERALASHD